MNSIYQSGFGGFLFTCGQNTGRICAKLSTKISQCQSLLHLTAVFETHKGHSSCNSIFLLARALRQTQISTCLQTVAIALPPSLSRQSKLVGRKMITRIRSRGGRSRQSRRGVTKKEVCGHIGNRQRTNIVQLFTFFLFLLSFFLFSLWAHWQQATHKHSFTFFFVHFFVRFDISSFF